MFKTLATFQPKKNAMCVERMIIILGLVQGLGVSQTWAHIWFAAHVRRVDTSSQIVQWPTWPEPYPSPLFLLPALLDQPHLQQEDQTLETLTLLGVLFGVLVAAKVSGRWSFLLGVVVVVVALLCFACLFCFVLLSVACATLLCCGRCVLVASAVNEPLLGCGS